MLHRARSRYLDAEPASWPLALPAGIEDSAVAALRDRAESLAASAQYGWGHTIRFGPFTMPGLLGEKYLKLAGIFDQQGWWPRDLTGLRVADVGCFTGGLTALMASRGAEIAAVDEVPEHLAQCSLLAEAFELKGITTRQRSLYRLRDDVGDAAFDLILCAGVLYHVSDMLVALIELQKMLRPGGSLLLESNAVESYDHSYANYGRFAGGMWWQPTAACIADMCEHAGFERPEIHFYQPGRAVAVVHKPDEPVIPFTRGLNLDVPDRQDHVARVLDPSIMAPAPDLRADAGMLRRFLLNAGARALQLPMRLGYIYRRLTRRSRQAQ